MTSNERKKRYRERQAAGRTVLAVEIDEVAVIEVLTTAGMLDPLRDHSREDLARAVERLLETLALPPKADAGCRQLSVSQCARHLARIGH